MAFCGHWTARRRTGARSPRGESAHLDRSRRGRKMLLRQRLSARIGPVRNRHGLTGITGPVELASLQEIHPMQAIRRHRAGHSIQHYPRYGNQAGVPATTNRRGEWNSSNSAAIPRNNPTSPSPRLNGSGPCGMRCTLGNGTSAPARPDPSRPDGRNAGKSRAEAGISRRITGEAADDCVAWIP